VVLGKLDVSMQFRTFTHTLHKTIQNALKLKQKVETVKLLEEKTGEESFTTLLPAMISWYDTKSIGSKGKIKLKLSWRAKETIKAEKTDYRMEKVFANHISNKGLFTKTK
jgi:hypothetical protein